MISKRFIILLITIATCSLVISIWLFKRNTGAVATNNQPRSFPVYVAEFEEYVALAGKAPVLSRKVLRAQRSDGALVEIEDNFSLNGSGQHYATRNIYCADRTLVFLHDAQRLGYATAKSFNDRRTDQGRFDPGRQCKVTYAGDTNFQTASEHEVVTSYGLSATRLESDSATSRHQVWRVPSVDCLEVRRLSEFKGQDGAVTNTSEYRLVKLEMAEPPAELFQVPPDYETVTPLQFFERLMPLLGTTLSETDRKMLERAEADYARNGIPLSALK